MNNLYFFVIGASAFVTVLTYIIAFMLVLKNQQKAPLAARYLMIAFGILAFSSFLSVVCWPLLARYFTPTQFAPVHGFVQLMNRIVFAFAVGLFIKAAFANRNPNSQAHGNEFLLGDGVKASADPNPFITPSAEKA